MIKSPHEPYGRETIRQKRRGQKIAVIVNRPEHPHGLAFVMHGLGGFKEQPHIALYAQTFLENGYTVVRFDTTNTFGESDGQYEDATTTNYYEDLEDVIAWAKLQLWYQEPFVLAGHSLGGICTALYAERYPAEVKGLAPTATAVSGLLSAEAKDQKGSLEEWRRTGWLVRESASLPGVIKRLKWSHMEDRMKYDLLPAVKNLTIPVLLLVGEYDGATPPDQQQVLYEKLPGPKELHVIKGMEHTPREPVHLAEIRSIFDRWIKNVLS